MEAFEYHLLPAVKQAVARLAVLVRWLLAGAAALALGELVLLPLHFVLPGLVCGMVSVLVQECALALLVLLAAWCHPVLLAGQGSVITRWLLRMGAVLVPLVPVCRVYTFFTGELLLYRQAELPFILGVFLLLAALVNIPKMAAARAGLQVRIVALPVVLLAVLVCDLPGLLVFCTVFKMLAAWLAWVPLRQLAALAPRVISMPPCP